MKGGLRLLLSKNNDGLDPVYEMAMNDKSIIKLMTASSLKGFIFTLEVPEDVSRYADINSDKTGFDKIITNFVIKIVLTSPISNKSMGNYKEKIKQYETKDEFYKEAKLQQEIWMKSIENGASEICPSVANLSFLDKQNTQRLLSTLANKSNNDKNMIDVLTFLNKNNTDGMGILTMKNYTNSKTLSEYLDDKTVSQKDRQHVLDYTAVKVIRLALLGYVHYDLHKNNVLVTDDINNKSVLIDFGRVIKIRNFFNYFNSTIEWFLQKHKKEDYILNIRNKYNNGGFNILNDLNAYITDVNTNKMDTKHIEHKLGVIIISVLNIDMYILAYEFHQVHPQSIWLSEADIDTELFLNEAFKKNSHPIVFDEKGFAPLNPNYWEMGDARGVDPSEPRGNAHLKPRDGDTPLAPAKKKKCPKGTRRNKKTGNCEPRGVARGLTPLKPRGNAPSKPHDIRGLTPSEPRDGDTPLAPAKKKKCPKGTRRNKKTGNCEPRGVARGLTLLKPRGVAPSEPPVKKPKCPKGTRRNKKTGNCEPIERPRGEVHIPSEVSIQSEVPIPSEHKEAQKSPAEHSHGLSRMSPLGLKGVKPLGLAHWIDAYIQENNLSLNNNERYVKLLHMNKVQDSFTPLFKNDSYDYVKDIFKDLYILKTIGDGSCFIHALFTALSKNYLRMNDNDKRDMAKYFRKNVLAKMKDDEYKSESSMRINPEKTKEYKKNFENEKFYLTNEEIILIANKYKINFMFFKTEWSGATDISPIYVNNDPRNRDNYDWIYIENSGVHYETIIHDNDAGEVYMTFSPEESENILDKLKFKYYGA